MLGGHLPNDYDVYFRTKETATKVAKYYLAQIAKPETEKTGSPEVHEKEDGIEIIIRSAGIAGDSLDQQRYDYFEMLPDGASENYLDQLATKPTGKYKVVFTTSNAITISDSIQLIIRFCGEPEVIHSNYDFVHCTNYWTFGTGLKVNQPALESILARELKYVGSKFPLCSMFRLRKFIDRGWTITAGEIFKIAWDISKLDLTNLGVLQDQLTGLDTSYFAQVINILKSDYDVTKDIDRTYLFELVSRTFDAGDLPVDSNK
jgi:hypothetical protein